MAVRAGGITAGALLVIAGLAFLAHGIGPVGLAGAIAGVGGALVVPSCLLKAIKKSVPEEQKTLHMVEEGPEGREIACGQRAEKGDYIYQEGRLDICVGRRSIGTPEIRVFAVTEKRDAEGVSYVQLSAHRDHPVALASEVYERVAFPSVARAVGHVVKEPMVWSYTPPREGERKVPHSEAWSTGQYAKEGDVLVERWPRQKGSLLGAVGRKTATGIEPVRMIEVDTTTPAVAALKALWFPQEADPCEEVRLHTLKGMVLLEKDLYQRHPDGAIFRKGADGTFTPVSRPERVSDEESVSDEEPPLLE